MINRATTITVDYCPVLDDKADLDIDCAGCEFYQGLNKDQEVLCNFVDGECQRIGSQHVHALNSGDVPAVQNGTK